MPLAVTCQCGSRLEIDEKFLGKEILCPDCQRPLPTKAPSTPPPLDLPLHKRACGFAIISLTSSLVGMFTLVGSVVGIVLGAVALRRIAKNPAKLEGAGMARAGIITGVLGIVLTILAFLFPILTLGTDEYLRWLAYASRTQIPINGEIRAGAEFGANVTIKVPSGWRQYNSSPAGPGQKFLADDLLVVNVPQNAWVSLQKIELALDDDFDTRDEKARQRFYSSEIVNILGRLGDRPFDVENNPGEISGRTDVPGGLKGKDHEFYLDVRLGGQVRRFLIRWKAQSDVRLIIMVGEAPRSRFDRVEADIRKIFDTTVIK